MTRVIVTGAASGIGAATVAALRDRGARVVGLDIRSGPELVECDVRDQASADAAVVEAIGRLGGVDVLMNVAGIARLQDSGGPPGEDALAVLDVNLLGPWRVTAAALPALRQTRGRVINVASGLVFLTIPFVTAYCASKRGLAAYSDALRLEHGDHISVTTVYPGYIRTPIHDVGAAHGLSLEGRVPSEPIEAAVKVLVRCALGPRPPHDVATTRRGALAYFALRHLPARLVHRAVARRTRFARTGHLGRRETWR